MFDVNRLQLPAHDVHLRVTYGEDIAFRFSRAGGVPFNSKMHTVLCVDKALAVTVHSCVGH